jgi:hypothetical protein
VVTLADASRWTANYRKTIPAGDIIAQFFGKNQLIKILNQKGCMGIRFYYGIGDDGVKNLIAVGATSDKNDMIDGIILEKAIGCPPECPSKNSLNS